MDERLLPGIHPFWFWNAPLDPAAIERQVAALAAGGCRGVFIHPRQGLGVPYLSAAFFELIRTAVRSCRRHGIRPQIYDEFPYPSGIAGGLVTMGHPELVATALRHVVREHPGGAVAWELPAGAVLSCQAVPLDDAGAADWRRVRDLTEAVGVAYASESWYQGGLSPYGEQRFFAHEPRPQLACTLPVGRWRLVAAVQCRIEGHKYWGDYVDVCDPVAMRRFIALTHEAYARELGPDLLGAVGCVFVDEIAPGWSRHFPVRYAERHGEALESLLPALEQADHPRHRELVARLADLRYDAFVAAFEQPVAEWCHGHGLLYVAEKPLLRLDQLRFVDVPGCDAGHVRIGRRHDLLRPELRLNARATASAAQIYAKAGALCEAFHSLGWSATLADARRICDHLLLHGIDRIVPHGAFASTHGLRKHDAPPSWFVQQPHWPLFHHLAERIAAVSAAIGPLHHDADLLVVEPGYDRRSPGGAAYEDLLHALTTSSREYLIVDRSWLLGHDPAAGAIAWGERRIGDVVVSVDDDDAELDGWLARFERAGGVVSRGALPDDAELPGLRVLEGDPATLHQARFRGADGLRYWAINDGDTVVRVALPTGYAPISVGDAPTLIVDAAVALDPGEALLLAPGEADASVPVVDLPITGRWRCQPAQANLLRLARWDLTVVQDGLERGTGGVEPMPIGDQLAAAAIPVVHDRCPRFGLPARLAAPRLDLRYRCCVQVEPGTGALCLVLEPDSLRGSEPWIAIDGERRPLDLGPVAHHVEGSLGLELGALGPGEHILDLGCTVDRDQDGLLAPGYLAGDVAVEPGTVPTLRPPRDHAPCGDLDAAGLAHYAGTIEWASEVDVAAPEAEAVVLRFDDLSDDAWEVALNDGPWRPLPWLPHRLVVPSAELRAGANAIRLRQHTSLGRSFDGERWDAIAHRRVSVDVDGNAAAVGDAP